MLNLGAVLLHLCQPFCTTADDPKSLKIDPTYGAVLVSFCLLVMCAVRIVNDVVYFVSLCVFPLLNLFVLVQLKITTMAIK